MKFTTLALVSLFAASTQAYTQNDLRGLPTLICTNTEATLEVFPEADQKQSTIVISAGVGQHAVEMFSVSTQSIISGSDSVFMGPDLVFYVAPSDAGLKGFLRTNPDQPGVETSMDCVPVISVQPERTSAI